MALVMAPFLLLIGWIAADYYDANQQVRNNQYQLSGQESCDLPGNNCLLTFEQLRIQVQTEMLPDGRVFRLISSHEMENVLLSVVDKSGNETPLTMQSIENEFQWQAFFPQEVTSPNGSYKLRFAGSNASGFFFAELQG